MSCCDDTQPCAHRRAGARSRRPAARAEPAAPPRRRVRRVRPRPDPPRRERPRPGRHARARLGHRGRPARLAARRPLGVRRRDRGRLQRADRGRGLPRHRLRLERPAPARRPGRVSAAPAGRRAGLGQGGGRHRRRSRASRRHPGAGPRDAGAPGADLRGRRRHAAPLRVEPPHRDVGPDRRPPGGTPAPLPRRSRLPRRRPGALRRGDALWSRLRQPADRILGRERVDRILEVAALPVRDQGERPGARGRIGRHARGRARHHPRRVRP